VPVSNEKFHIALSLDVRPLILLPVFASVVFPGWGFVFAYSEY
jgi:hypothetical protein